MDLKQIKSLLNLISESDVNEVYIEEGDFKIKIKKQSDTIHQAPPVQYTTPQAPQIVEIPSTRPSSPAPVPTQEGGNQQPTAISGEIIKSPIVGTFYSSPSPEDKPFVSVGDTIQKGDTLCIIEAMKIMNEINAEVSGKITKILVSNAQPVEYDQPLFEIEPS
ncbi:MAG: acetyl-CoA carboxylase biotin carboxyl carrier protein AccB [Bacteroidetes bacterium HLUCCA01]|nr:MAG: acetyl-CoA carboxylase biotin carboxyl carrier protein AccB [Bacteroidetes bacterium HLUCCA01]